MKITTAKHEFTYGFEVERKGISQPLIDQVHGSRTIWIERIAELEKADGLATSDSGRSIYVFTADCVPVLLLSDEASSIAAIHSGWRGALQGVVRKALEEPHLRNPAVIVGPHIRRCCFEVREDFIEAFRRAGRPCKNYLEMREGRTFFDLTSFLLEEELTQIPRSKVDLSAAVCTFCSPQKYPSYRRDGAAGHRIKSWVRFQKR